MGIDLALSVTDRHASAAWFQQMLGFEAAYHADEAGWSEIHTNTTGVTIGLGEHAKPAPGNCVPVFGIADLDTARQKLEQAMGAAFGRRNKGIALVEQDQLDAIVAGILGMSSNVLEGIVRWRRDKGFA